MCSYPDCEATSTFVLVPHPPRRDVALEACDEHLAVVLRDGEAESYRVSEVAA